MSPLVPISAVTERLIQDAILETIRGGFDPEPLGEVLARIDWSGGGHEPVRVFFALLTAWTDEFVEGRMTEDAYAGRLLALLPLNITAPSVPLVTDAAERQPQTTPRPSDQAPALAQSSSVPAA